MSRHDSIVVVCATDARYVIPLAVMLRSAVDNLAEGRKLIVHILYSGVNESDRVRAARNLPGDRCVIDWIPVDESKVAGVPLWGRMPVATYFKLLMPDVLGAVVTRAIWLDCDLLLNSDLGELWDTELNGSPVGAVQDELVPMASSRGGIASRADLGIPDDSKYFNAGVMLIDLDQWRAQRVTAMALDYLKRRWKSVVFWDQEGLNVALAGKWMALAEKWNCNVSLPSKRGGAGSSSSAAILHFAGMLKPWNYRTKDPEWTLYMRCLDRTSWEGTRPRRNARTMAISAYERSGMRPLLYPLESFVMELVRRVSRSATSGSRVSFASPVQAKNQ